MAVPSARPAVLAAALALASLALTGCGLGGGDSGGGAGGGPEPADDAGPQARARVQAYLDAMTAKDPAAGRSQLCTPLHASFDQAATGPNGDFAPHFKVSAAQISAVAADGGRQRVTAVVEAEVGKRRFARSLVFAVTPVDGAWCIAAEEPGPPPESPTPAAPGGAPTPSPAAPSRPASPPPAAPGGAPTPSAAT